MRLEIGSSWDGAVAGGHERATVTITPGDSAWEVLVDAPWHGDPAPDAPVGCLDGLWAYEVVELFLLGRDDRYLELELGPHGHWLALALHGRRQRVGIHDALAYEVRRDGGRWRGRAVVPTAWLPPGLKCANAYAIHGVGDARRYLCHAPTLGAQPDFHALERFVPLPRPLLRP